MSPDPAALAAASSVAGVCGQHIRNLVGVYLHGSGALGGFGAASDVDVLVITGEDVGGGGRALGEALLGLELGHPLELSVVRADAAASPGEPWPYLFHVAGEPDRIVRDHGVGDRDLISHYLVTRARGVAVRGPAPADVIGEIDRGTQLAYLRDELHWGLRHAEARYAVLNAARAVAYARDGLVLSKLEGAAWWRATFGPDDLVESAAHAQQAGAPFPLPHDEVRDLVLRARDLLR